MYFRPAILALFTLLLLASGTGCKKNGSSTPAAPPTVLAPDTVARVHWIGKRQLDLEAGAFFFSRIWSLPETGRLQSQTFDKLATGSWRVLLGAAAAAQIPAAVLRPVFDDLVLEESYLEVRAATNSQLSTINSQQSTVLAIHIIPRRAGLWETNLAIAAELLAGSAAAANPATHGWTIQRTNAPARITLNRVGDWTVLALGPEQNSLLAEITARIQRDGVPFVSSGTNLWLEATLAPARLAAAFSSLSAHQMGGEGRGEVGSALNSQLKNLSTLNFTLAGDGGNILTHVQLSFVEPFSTPIGPWQIPVNLIHEPLLGFTAVRGVQPWLAAWKRLTDLQFGALPDQLYLWSLASNPGTPVNPYQTYLAAPLPAASQQVAALSELLLQQGNPWLATNGYISFDRAADANGVTWGNLPDIKPFIKSAGTGTDGFLFAGLLPDTNNAAAPPPAGMIQDILHRTNLVYYDWEVTGPRLQPMLQLGQTARQIARRPQMAMDSAGINWLAMLIPRLGTSATIITRTGPAELTLYRRSTLGFNALELHLFADWLESPQFPYALHSTQP